MQVIVPDWPGLPACVRALTTVRYGGESLVPYGSGNGDGDIGGLNLGLHVGDRQAAVLANRRRLRVLLPSEPAWLTQVHGTTVLDAGEAARADAPQADASIAVGAGAVCTIMTADCLPVLFYGVRHGAAVGDRSGIVVGAAHAGWRGLLNGVLENTVAALRAAGACEIGAWMGPAIGPLRFEVGAEVRDAYLARNMAFADAFTAIDGAAGKYLADIYRLARTALAAVDVLNVAGGDFCTVDDSRRFYSYRRDGVTGRFATLIWVD